jgi:glycosyltransferase involved in cell wall biosynthesis
MTEPLRSARMTEPLVSIVILCHNYGRYLAEAIESALAQDYPKLELIVVDDGSTDDSLEVASRYGDRLKMLTQENQGLARTCNRGVREATGELFVFLSADDRLEPSYVSELIAALERQPNAWFAYCAARLFGAESGVMPSRPFSAFSLIRGRNYINGSALTRRAEYLEAGGYPEDLGEGAFDDWDFWLTMVEHGNRGTYVSKPLLHWRRHAGGSKNPASRGTTHAETARIRARHADLHQRVSGVRGDLGYAFDRAVGLAERLFRISRSPSLLRAVEQASWRRFERAMKRAV